MAHHCPAIIMGARGTAKSFNLPDIRSGVWEMISVLLVDEQSVVRRGLLMRLALEPDLKIVGAAKSSEEALVLARRTVPDVVVMDIEMPRSDGVQAIRQMRDLTPNGAVSCSRCEAVTRPGLGPCRLERWHSSRNWWS